MSKTLKKSVSVTKSRKASAQKQNPIGLIALIVISSIIVGPALWYFFGNVLFIFVIPALVSFVVAFMYQDLIGEAMNRNFRNETTAIVALLAVVLAVVITVKSPMVGLDGIEDTKLPILMIFFRSVWALTATLLTVYLPLGVTIPKK
jgi:hypothetical protein